MAKWNCVAMGQVALTGWTKAVAQPLARTAGRKTGRPGTQILSLIDGLFLAITLIDFLREVDAFIAAGRAGRQPATLPLRRTRTDLSASAIQQARTVGGRANCTAVEALACYNSQLHYHGSQRSAGPGSAPASLPDDLLRQPANHGQAAEPELAEEDMAPPRVRKEHECYSPLHQLLIRC